MKLLLADDDIDQLELRRLTLTKAGYETCIASDEETALRHAVEQKPVVAVVDFRFPTEDVGLRLIRALKKLDSAMRVIVLTGVDAKRFRTLPEHALVEAVITKGNASRQLLEHLTASEVMEARKRLAAAGQLVLDVKVVPRSSKSEVVSAGADGVMKVKVNAAPEKGKANEESLAVLAEYFGVQKQAVQLLSGETSQIKRVLVRSSKAI